MERERYIKKRNTFITNVMSGFTLIELIVVIAVVGLLAVGVMTVINPVDQVQKSRDARRKADLSSIAKALELFYQDNGYFPDSMNGFIYDDVTSQTIEWGSDGFKPYMQQVPKDMNSSKKYSYHSTGESYWIFASLDRGGKDNQACNAPDDSPCSRAVVVGAQCGEGSLCNYGISSPNVSVN